MKKIVAVSMVALLLAGCSQNGGMDGRVTKSDVGTIVGAAAGAAIGSNLGKGKGNIVGIAAGTLLGAALGNSLGASLDRMDAMYYERTAQSAFETGRSGTSSTWRNPDSGNSGTITPMNVTQNNSGEYCREYRQTIQVGGKTQEGYGTACRNPDGTWRIIN